ncbi:MAG: ribonuclease HI [Epulopiscium sp. Nele67-Bin005]|nr:MAG: ribonuclease HI [Epulopiscium sp. Nele67-Bin005]
MNEIIIYCDGGCRGNQNANNIGAWGCVLSYNGHVKELSGTAKNTTNNKMELVAAIKSLQALKKYDMPIKVYVDSAYVQNGINNWIYGWIKKGWVDAKKNPVKNRELWEELFAERQKFSNIEFLKVKGHSDNAGNNRADELCNIAMDNM